MRQSGLGTPAKKTMLAVLLAGAGGALLLPDEWTGKLISIVQVIVPFQHAASGVAGSVSGALEDEDPPVSAEAYEALRREKAALEHRIAALTVRASQLEREVGILTATRLWEVEGRRIGAAGRLIPAGVVTADLLPWRSSRLINAGSLQGVQRGAAVTSCFFTVDRGDKDGVRDGMAILLGETLVGLVEQTGTHTSRVKLLSDVSVEMKVRIGRFGDGEFVLYDGYFWLTGRGRGTMQIRDVDRRGFEAGVIQAGDIVLSDPASAALPTAMTIGKVVEITPDRDNPLLCILTVESEVSERGLRRVYVYDPGTVADKDAAGVLDESPQSAQRSQRKDADESTNSAANE